MPFRCPVCSSRNYDRVIIERPDGTPYRSDLCHCSGCTAVFLEPELFTAALKYRESALPPDEHQMQHEVALDRQSLQLRYWRARYKRRDGGCEPKDEAVVRFMLRMTK